MIKLLRTIIISEATSTGALFVFCFISFLTSFNSVAKFAFLLPADSYNFNNLLTENNKRGFHANLNFNELIIVIEGSVKITLIDKNSTKETCIVNKDNLYYVPKLKWIEYEILDKETIILCLVDKDMNESISICNFEEFINK